MDQALGHLSCRISSRPAGPQETHPPHTHTYTHNYVTRNYEISIHNEQLQIKIIFKSFLGCTTSAAIRLFNLSGILYLETIVPISLQVDPFPRAHTIVHLGHCRSLKPVCCPIMLKLCVLQASESVTLINVLMKIHQARYSLG